MPINKEATNFLTSQTLGAGATITGSAFDLREKFGTAVFGKMTNGANAPTVGPLFIVQVSTDNFDLDTQEVFRGIGDTTALSVTTLLFRIPPEVLYARIRFENNDGQSITVEATGHTIKTVG